MISSVRSWLGGAVLLVAGLAVACGDDGVSDEAQFFVDAVEHPSLATTSDVHGGNDVAYDLPSFRSVWFGWWQYQSDPTPFDVWIDEVAIDHERVGCKL